MSFWPLGNVMSTIHTFLGKSVLAKELWTAGRKKFFWPGVSLLTTVAISIFNTTQGRL